MSFAVCHASKVKGGAGGLGSHIDREHAPKNANPQKTPLNVELCEVQEKLHQAINIRIKEGYTGKRAIRKDAVRAVSLVLSGSHERMKEIEKDRRELLKWAKDNYDFVAKEFGEKNLVRCTLHLDEKTPHLHAVVVPITEDGRLSAKDWLDGKKKLRGLQDRYGEAMKKWGLQRGLSNSNRRHVSTADFYRYLDANHLDAQKILKSPHAQEVVSQMLQELQGKDQTMNIEQHIRTNQNHYERQVFEGGRGIGEDQGARESDDRSMSRGM